MPSHHNCGTTPPPPQGPALSFVIQFVNLFYNIKSEIYYGYWYVVAIRHCESATAAANADKNYWLEMHLVLAISVWLTKKRKKRERRGQIGCLQIKTKNKLHQIYQINGKNMFFFVFSSSFVCAFNCGALFWCHRKCDDVRIDAIWKENTYELQFVFLLMDQLFINI